MTSTLTLLTLSLVLAAPFAQAQTQAAAPASAPGYKYKTPRLDRTQLDALLAQPDRLVVVDVRRPDELTKVGGFPAYLSIQAKDLPQRLGYIPRDRQVVTVSNHAGRAGAAGDLLSAKGFTVVGAVGAQDYEAQGGTLSHIAAPAASTSTAAAAASAVH